MKLADNVDISFLAKQTPGFSGADIANVANEAALIAARKDKNEVEKQDFLDAIDRIVGGLENRSKVIKANEKKQSLTTKPATPLSPGYWNMHTLC